MTLSPVMRGIVAMVTSMVLFMGNDTFMKLATAKLPVAEVIGIRSLMAGVLLFALLVVTGDIRDVHHAFRRKVAIRSALDSATTYTYVVALAVLPISTSTTIYMAAPLITTALAVPMLGETVSFKRWCAIIVGFAGAVIVTHPDPSTFDMLALLPLLAALFGSIRDIGTRSIASAVPATVISFSSSVVLSVTGLIFAIMHPWTWPDLASFLYMAGSGICYAAGTLCLVYAFRNAPVRAVSPLRYVLVPLALVVGYFVFGHIPDGWASVGAVLVVGAGLYSIHQEAVRGRAENRAARALNEAAATGCATPLAGAITRAPPR